MCIFLYLSEDQRVFLKEDTISDFGPLWSRPVGKLKLKVVVLQFFSSLSHSLPSKSTHSLRSGRLLRLRSAYTPESPRPSIRAYFCTIVLLSLHSVANALLFWPR